MEEGDVENVGKRESRYIYEERKFVGVIYNDRKPME